MNRICVQNRAARDIAGPARLLQLAGAALLAAAAFPAIGQQSNQPGESDLYHRSGEQSPGARRTVQEVIILRDREGTYAPDAWRRAWEQPAETDTTIRERTVTYQQAAYRPPGAALPPAMPDDAAFRRGDRTMGRFGSGAPRPMMSQSGFETPGPYATTGSLAPPQYGQPYQYQQMNLPPSSPEYFSEFGRPNDQVLYLRGQGARTWADTQPRVQTTAQRVTTTERRPRDEQPVVRRGQRGEAVSYGDVNYYSEIGYGDFSYYSDFEKEPSHRKHRGADSRTGARTTTVRSTQQPGVVTTRGPGQVETVRYRETDTDVIYYTDDPRVSDWLDQADMNR